jgi:hypothetical protein
MRRLSGATVERGFRVENIGSPVPSHGSNYFPPARNVVKNREMRSLVVDTGETKGKRWNIQRATKNHNAIGAMVQLVDKCLYDNNNNDIVIVFGCTFFAKSLRQQCQNTTDYSYRPSSSSSRRHCVGQTEIRAPATITAIAKYRCVYYVVGDDDNRSTPIRQNN